MKHLFLFLLFLIPVLLSAQDPLPANPRKLRLGYQTDGEGIVLYGSGGPSYTPTRYRSAFHYMDTTNNIYYQYNRIEAKWDTILAGAGAVADGVSVDNSTWSKIGGTDVQQALTKTDSVLNNITIDGNQIQNKFEATTTTLTVSADSIAAKQRYTIVSRNATSGNTLRVVFPQPSPSIEGRIINLIDSTVIGANTYIEVDTTGGQDSLRLKIGGRFASRYYPDQSGTLLIVSDGVYEVIPGKRDYEVRTRRDVLNKRFFRGEKVLDGKYKIQPNIPRKYDNTTMPVDSIFIIPVKDAAPWGENLATNTNTGGTAATIIANAYVGANGKRGAIAVVRSTAGSAALRFTFTADNPEIGDKWAVQFHARKSAGVSDLPIAVQIRSQAGRIRDTLTSSSEYKYVSGVIETDNSTFVNYVQIDWTSGAGDTLFISDFQIERASSASDYKQYVNGNATSWGEAYAVYEPVNGVIYFNDITFPDRYTQSQAFQATLNYCGDVAECTKVVTTGLKITEPITIPIGVQWEDVFPSAIGAASGIDNTYNSWVDIEITDSTYTADAVTFQNQIGSSSDYIVGQRIENIAFRVLAGSKIRSVVNPSRSIDGVIRNIYITADDGLDYTDSLFLDGVSVQTALPNSLNLDMSRIDVKDASRAGINTGGARVATIYKSKILSCRNGIIGGSSGSGEVELSDVWIEDIYQDGINFTGDRLQVENVFFENIAILGSGSAIDVDGVTKVKISSMSFAAGVTNATKIKARNTGTIELDNIELAFLGVDYDIDCSNGTVLGMSPGEIDWYIASGQVCEDIFHAVAAKASGKEKTLLNNLSTKNSTIDSSYINKAQVDSLFFSENSYWIGRTINLYPDSDSISSDTVIVATGRAIIYRDSIVGPSGLKDAELISIDNVTGSTNIFISLLNAIEPIIQDEWYNLSYWGKVINSGDADGYIFNITSNIAGNSLRNRRMKSTEWRRYNVQFKASSTAQTIQFQIGDYAEGDAFAVTDIQLTPGKFLRSYIPTTGTGKRDSSIVINSEKTIQFSDMNAFDGGELYILPTDPDTLDFSAAGGLFDQIQDMTIGTLDNFTSSGDTLYYTGSVTRPFTVNFTATLEADTGTQELQMRITKNAASLDKCTVSKDYSTSGVEVQITGTCRLDLSTNDAIALEVSPTQNTSQLLVRRANINLH